MVALGQRKLILLTTEPPRAPVFFLTNLAICLDKRALLCRFSSPRTGPKSIHPLTARPSRIRYGTRLFLHLAGHVNIGKFNLARSPLFETAIFFESFQLTFTRLGTGSTFVLSNAFSRALSAFRPLRFAMSLTLSLSRGCRTQNRISLAINR